MAEHILVNNKKYIPSTVLSGQFGYTADYIGKLAREEKVLGRQIDRQWFVEPVSLELYFHKISVEKEIKKEALRAQRKRERVAHELFLNKKTAALEINSTIKKIETFAVVMCGLCIGGLGWIAQTQELDLHTLSLGAQEASVRIAEAIDPRVTERQVSNALSKTVDTQETSVAATTLDPLEDVVFTTLPRPSSEAASATSSESNLATYEKVSFSDDVRVVEGTDGVLYIAPVLRERAATSTFMLVPTSDQISPVSTE